MILKKIIQYFILAAVLVLTNEAFAQRVKENNRVGDSSLQFPPASRFSNSRFTYKIIPVVNTTYGYDVFADGKLMIHQYSIPALGGNEGFKSKAAAEKVAKLVIEKIKKGEMPPTVSIDEMKKLKAI